MRLIPRPKSPRPDTADVAAVSALDEPTRRRLYDFVCRSERPVSRDDAAEALGISRKTVAFHLDKLADAGLLETGFSHLGRRKGPGSGRPSKLYRRADRSISVHLPERSYELAGRLLAQAIDDSAQDSAPPQEHLAQRAAEFGRAVGTAAEGGTDELMAVLERCGYEPRTEDDAIVLANCPFHALVADHTDLVCSMNLDLVSGIIDGARCSGCRADLRPHDGYCCVRITPSA